MSGEKKSSAADPGVLWEQWYQAASAAWKRDADADTKTFVDPFGIYRAWLKSAGETQQQLLSGAAKAMEPREAWQRWLEATIEPWRKVAASGADSTGLVKRWLEIMQEGASPATGSAAAEPFTFFKQWYDATSERWSKAAREIVGSDSFTQASSQLMEGYASFTRAMGRAGEEYFGMLQLCTRSDIVRVAQLVINVENKADTLDMAFEDFTQSAAQAATATQEAIAGVTSRLGGVEEHIAALPGKLQRPADADILLQRLERVEQKLDALLSALQEREAAPAETPTSTPPPRKRQPSRSRPATNGNTRRKAAPADKKLSPGENSERTASRAGKADNS
jgi:polyhydroxyalkanoic acid synthase PhaR subunit